MHLVLFIIVNIFAAIFASIVGLGHALIVNPLALTFLSKDTTLTAIMVAGTLLFLFLTKKIKEPLAMDIFKPLVISCFVGMPFGLLILKTLPIDGLRIFVGGISVLSAVALQFSNFKIHNQKRVTPVIGFICGVLQTSTGITGPPVAILLASLGVAKHKSRKIMATFFFVISLMTLPLYLATGILNRQGIIYGLCAVPFILVAGHYGNKLAEYVPPTWYRTLMLGTVGVTGAYAIFAGSH
jgi:uncharacterized membrane protein YfcA